MHTTPGHDSRNNRPARRSLLAAALLLLSAALPMHVAPPLLQAADAPAPGSAPGAAAPKSDGVFLVSDYGVVDGNQIKPAYRAAVEAAAKAGGGIVVIPAAAARDFAPPSPDEVLAASKSTAKPGTITVVDLRLGAKVTPPTSGLMFNRSLKLAVGESLPHWDYYPMLELQNNILRGATSYREAILANVEAGKDRKFYVTTIRGIFPGMFATINEWGDVQRLYIKSLGFDKSVNQWYFVADTDADIPKGAYVGNKNHVNALVVRTSSHSEGQATDVLIDRENYSQGDNYLFDARFKYMGDIHSTGGDENGVIFAAFIEGMSDICRGNVNDWDPTTRTLAINGKTDTLGNGRPIINLNPSKWVSIGKARIVKPPDWSNPDAPADPSCTYEGKTYPTKREIIDGKPGPLIIGGLIKLSPESPVTAEHVGWYFAIDDSTEWLPVKKGEANPRIRRWYQIASVTEAPGKDILAPVSKVITIIRHQGGARPAGAPTLYRDSNYTRDGQDRPLSYIIAPGANAYDVSEAVGKSGPIKLSPSTFERTHSDFEKGDAVEQAVGSDPSQPIPFQVHLDEKVPPDSPHPVFDIINTGGVGRGAVMSVRGGVGYDQKPSFHTFMRFDSPANAGIVFNGANANGAIIINQNGRESPIVFRYGPDKERKESRISVVPETGVIKLTGTGVQVTGPLTAVTGLSGTATPAANLRGVAIAVPKGSTELLVKFPKPEADAKYAPFVETSWLTARAVVNLKPEGFTVKFDAPAEDNSVLYWLIVR